MSKGFENKSQTPKATVLQVIWTPDEQRIDIIWEKWKLMQALNVAGTVVHLGLHF